MKPLNIYFSLTIGFAILMNCNLHAQFSRYVDFDGSGFGTLYTSSGVSTPQGVCVSGCGGPLGIPSGNNQQSYNNQVQALNQQRLEQQQLDRQKEKEKQELIEKINRIKKQQESIENLQELQKLQDALNKLSNQDVRTRYNLKTRIIDSLSIFEQQQRIFRNKQNDLLRRISQSILEIKVPAPETPPLYKSVLFLGMFQTPEIARQAKEKGLKNPFTDMPYDGIFAFGSAETLKEIKRVTLDHLLGDFNLLSKNTFRELGAIRGATIENIVASSNGAKVAEVLIRSGFIEGVKTFRILGGDGALMNMESLQQLATEKGIKIYVYATKDDPVPLTPTGWQILKMAEQLTGGRLAQFNKVKNLTYEVLGLKEAKASDKFKVQVELLYYHSRSSDIFEPHWYSTYHAIIKGRQLSGCLDKSGDIKQKCIIY